MQPVVDLAPKQRRKRKEAYESEVKAALAQVWEGCDYSCAQKLKPLLEAEVNQLREFRD